MPSGNPAEQDAFAPEMENEPELGVEPSAIDTVREAHKQGPAHHEKRVVRSVAHHRPESWRRVTHASVPDTNVAGFHERVKKHSTSNTHRCMRSPTGAANFGVRTPTGGVPHCAQKCV